MILIERKVAQKTWVIHTNSETHKRRIRRKRNLINKLFDWRSSRTNGTNGIPLMSLRWKFPDHYPLTPWEDQNTALHGLFRTLFGRESSDSEVLKESEESDGHQSAGYDSHRMIDQKSSDFRDFIICFAKNRNCFCTLKIFWLKVGQNWSMEFVWNMMQEKHTNLSKEFLSSEVFWKKFEILYAPVLLQSYWSNSWISTLLEHSIGEKLNSKPSKHFRGQRAEFNWPIGRPI